MYAAIYEFFNPSKKSNKLILSFDDEGKNYINFIEEYRNKNAWGMSTSLDCSSCNSELIRSSQKIEEYVIGLCNLIKMTRYGECFITHFGKEQTEGYTMVQLIETSNITAHFSNFSNSAYIDLFSCKPYDANLVAEYTKNFFKASNVNINVVLRK